METISFDSLNPINLQETQAPETISASELQTPDLRAYARQKAQEYGHPDPEVFVRQINAESGFNPNAIGPETKLGRPKGIAQFMPGTAAGMGVKNVFDPYESLDAAARYKKQLLDQFNGDDVLATAAYNAGPENVRKHGGVPPFSETIAYVNKIHGPRPGARTVKQEEFDKSSFPADQQYSDINTIKLDVLNPASWWGGVNEWATKQTPEAQGVTDWATRVVPTSAAKLGWQIAHLPYYMASALGQPLSRDIQNQIDFASAQSPEERMAAEAKLRENAGSSAFSGEVLNQAKVLADFMGERSGIYDVADWMTGQQKPFSFERLKTGALTDPAGVAAAVGGLVGGGLAARMGEKPEYSKAQRSKLARDEASLLAQETAQAELGRMRFPTEEAAIEAITGYEKGWKYKTGWVPEEGPDGWKVSGAPELGIPRPIEETPLAVREEAARYVTPTPVPIPEPAPKMPEEVVPVSTSTTRWEQVPEVTQTIVRGQLNRFLENGADPVLLNEQAMRQWGVSADEILGRKLETYPREEWVKEWQQIVKEKADESRRKMVEELRSPLPEDQKVTIPPEVPVAKEEPIVPAPPTPRAKTPDWLANNIDTIADPLEKSGVADKIEELSAQRKTAREVALELGLGIDDVRAVRAKRGIPSMDDRTEFESWIKSRSAIPAAPSGPTMVRKADGTMMEKEALKKEVLGSNKARALVLETLENGGVISHEVDPNNPKETIKVLRDEKGDIVKIAPKILEGTIAKFSQSGILDYVPVENRYELKEGWQTEKSIRSENPYETKESRYRTSNQVGLFDSYSKAREWVKSQRDTEIPYAIDQVGREFRVYEDPEARGGDVPNTVETRFEAVSSLLREDPKATLYSFPGPLGDIIDKAFEKTGEVIGDVMKPVIDKMWSLREKLDERLTSKGWYVGPTDPRREGYKKVGAYADKSNADKNVAIYKAGELSKEIKDLIPDERERNMFHAVREGTAPTGFKLSENAQRIYDRAVDVMDAYLSKLQTYGKLQDFVQDYFTRIVLENPENEKLPGFIPLKRREDMMQTTQDLIKKGYKIETDVAVWLPRYMEWAERHLANLEFMKNLKELSAEDGMPIIRPMKLVKPEQRGREFIQVNFADKLKRWDSPVKYGDEILQKEMAKLFDGEVWMHRDAYQTVDAMIFDPSEAYMKGIGHVQSLIKRVRMYNPMFHGWNVVGQQYNSLGLLESAKWVAGIKPEELTTIEGTRTLTERALRGGLQLEGLHDIRARLGMDQYKSRIGNAEFRPMDLIESPNWMWTHPLKTLGDLNNYLLFDRMVKSAQLHQFAVKEARYLRDGLEPGQASVLAAKDANNILGTLQPFSFTKNQRNYLRFLMFARDWNVSTARTVLGALPYAEATQSWLPKFLRTEGLDSAQWKSLSSQNRSYVLNAVIGATVSANLLQMMLQKANDRPVRPTWENHEGHMFDIDTGQVDSDGNTVYLRNALFRQVDDFYHAIIGNPLQVAVNKMEPLVSSTGRVVFNVDYQGEPIWGDKAGYTRLESLKNVAYEFIKNMPYEDITGRGYHVRNWLEATAPLFGTSTRHGPMHDPKLGDIMIDFYKSAGRYERMSKERLGEIKELMQKGQDEKALEQINYALTNREIDPGQLKHLMFKMEAPFVAKVLENRRFRDWLTGLPEKEQRRVMDTISNSPLIHEKDKRTTPLFNR